MTSSLEEEVESNWEKGDSSWTDGREKCVILNKQGKGDEDERCLF